MADLTPSELLAATAADMRAVADAADRSPSASAFWPRQSGKNALFMHVMTWSPTVARAVADWLDAEAHRYGREDEATQRYLFGQTSGLTPPQSMVVCEAWWASRGTEPKAVDRG